jgi:hypothetical protein
MSYSPESRNVHILMNIFVVVLSYARRMPGYIFFLNGRRPIISTSILIRHSVIILPIGLK